MRVGGGFGRPCDIRPFSDAEEVVGLFDEKIGFECGRS